MIGNNKSKERIWNGFSDGIEPLFNIYFTRKPNPESVILELEVEENDNEDQKNL